MPLEIVSGHESVVAVRQWAFAPMHIPMAPEALPTIIEAGNTCRTFRVEAFQCPILEQVVVHRIRPQCLLWDFLAVSILRRRQFHPRS